MKKNNKPDKDLQYKIIASYNILLKDQTSFSSKKTLKVGNLERQNNIKIIPMCIYWEKKILPKRIVIYAQNNRTKMLIMKTIIHYILEWVQDASY